MRAVLYAPHYAKISEAEEILEASPYFKKVEEYEHFYAIGMTNGAAIKREKFSPVFGFSAGGNLRVFIREPGELGISVDGTEADIFIVLDTLKIPKAAFQKACRE